MLSLLDATAQCYRVADALMVQELFVRFAVLRTKTSVCVVHGTGKVLWRGKCASTPEAMVVALEVSKTWRDHQDVVWTTPSNARTMCDVTVQRSDAVMCSAY